MKQHDNEATIYVASISPMILRGTLRFLCFSIANRWSRRYRCAVVPSEELCEEVGIGERHLGRLCRRLAREGILDYKPGQGPGNYSQFQFPALERQANTRTEGDENPTKPRQEADFSITRNKEEEPKPKSMAPEKPPASSSGLNSDNDAGMSAAIARVIKAFEENPLSTGKASASDTAVARLLLRSFTPEQIEVGMLLGTARKAASMKNSEEFIRREDPIGITSALSGRIQSFAYFSDPIKEAADLMTTAQFSEDYKRYLRDIIRRLVPKKLPASVTA